MKSEIELTFISYRAVYLTLQIMNHLYLRMANWETEFFLDFHEIFTNFYIILRKKMTNDVKNTNQNF